MKREIWDLHLLESSPPANPQALADLRRLLRHLEDAFGVVPLARVLGVEPAIVGRCLFQRSSMSKEMTRRVMDLHDVFTRAFQIFAPDTAMRWLVGSEPFFDGKRPIDVLAVRGAAPLIEAIDNIDAGAIA